MATKASLKPWLGVVPVPAQLEALPALPLFSMILLLVVTGVRSRVAGRAAWRISQVLTAALVLTIQVMVVMGAIADFSNQEGSQGFQSNLPMIVAIVGGGLILLGCLLALWNAGAASRAQSGQVLTARSLVLAGLLAISAWRVLRPGIETERMATILGPLNNLILAAGIAMICLEGLVGGVAWLTLRKNDEHL